MVSRPSDGLHRPQVYRGLAGFHLIRDDEEDALPLPRGERELPLLICDRAFDADGALRYPSLDRSLRSVPGVEPEWMEGVLGDVILVNGAPWPVADVDAARYRLRLLNASNARRYELTLDPPGQFIQIGTDGGLLAAPVTHQRLLLAPAQRLDVVVDFSTYPVGTEVTVANTLGNGGGTGQVMRFRVARPARDDSHIPNRLTEIEPLHPGPNSPLRTWNFARGHVRGHQGWTINGKPFDPSRIDAQPRLGQIERWRLTSDLHHPVHIHLDPFQILARRGRPDRRDVGWKDTIDLRPGQTTDIAIRFTEHHGLFMMHCHNLEHEDMAMMTTFETV